MTRRAAKTDANQATLVAGLRKLGVVVHPAHAMGHGFPDLVCGYQGVNYLLEVKDGSKPPSARKLTADQLVWHDQWRGQVAIVEDLDDALSVLGIELRGAIS